MIGPMVTVPAIPGSPTIDMKQSSRIGNHSYLGHADGLVKKPRNLPQTAHPSVKGRNPASRASKNLGQLCRALGLASERSLVNNSELGYILAAFNHFYSRR